MFRKQLCERGDGDIELVLSVLRNNLFGLLLCKPLGVGEGGDGGFVGARVSQGTEGNRVLVDNDVGVSLILECPCGNVGGILLDQGDDVALSSMWCRHNSYAICGLRRARLERVRTYQRHMNFRAYIRGSDPSSSSRTPFCYEKTKRMPGTEGNAGKKSPFFALEPIIVLDIVGICEQGVQGEEGEGIQMEVPWNCGLEGCPRNFWRPNVDANPR